MTKIDTLAIPNKPKDRSKVTNWSAHNGVLKRRSSLALWIDESVAGRGQHTTADGQQDR